MCWRLVSSRFPFQFGFEGAQRVKARLLELPDPAHGYLVDRNGVEVMKLLAPPPLHGHEVCLLQQAKVLRHRLPAHSQTVAQLAQGLPILRVQAV